MYFKQPFRQTVIAVLCYFACVGIAVGIDLGLLGVRNMYNTPALSALFAGWVYIRLIQKTQRFGPILALGAFMSIFFFTSGHFILAALPNLLAAILAELIAGSAHYKSSGRNLLSYMVFSLGNLAPIVTMWLAPKAYTAQLLAKGKSQTYIDQVMVPASGQHLLVLFGGTLLAAAIGYLLAHRWLHRFSATQ
ncbi:MptD family putative ECF transporter S component [Streptococcus sp. DD13]|uniref:MptD family putative ECF transporter S component n=1 Tax=Streptococcus sp. DD13 TaxID=1777881 RepID=UPI00079C09A5|nr:MptD family putative ECF transporter S component [Streptococcus sp. DD13]KXT79318.1 Substrate-specific component of putative ECF transporter [Streptococcus sp. DD13]